LWRANEEGHTLLEASAWAGSMLATQRIAGDAAVGEAED